MARRKREDAPPSEEPKDKTEKEVADQGAERPKRKYTRRKTAKVRWNPDMGSETLQAIAEAPLIAANLATTSLLGVVLQYQPNQVAKLGPALGQLLQGMEIEVGPGWLLLGLYGSVITTGVLNAVPIAVAQEAAKRAAEAQAKTAPAHAGEPKPADASRTVKVVPTPREGDASTQNTASASAAAS